MWLLALLACSSRPAAPPPSVQERFGDWPFLIPIDAPPTVATVGGGALPTDAATCGACHPEHHAEWAGSTHAHAMRDLQFLAELAKPGQPRWLCLNCHIPTRPQRQERILPETRLAEPGQIARLETAPEPAFDPARVEEGVSCATCHVRRDDDGQGIVVGPRGSGRAPHRVRSDPDALSGICVRCHSPGPAVISATFTCWFETADEIAAGPTPDASCVGCHMPSIERPAAVGGPDVTLRRHLWLGGGVPKTYAGYDRLAEQGWEPALDVRVERDPLRITLTNARAAHRVPTADPERHLQVVARAESASGDVLARWEARIGQSWDWGDEASGRVARRLHDDRLLPGEARALEPVLALDGAARLVVEVAHVRLTPENAAHMQATALDAELVGLWPEAPDRLVDLPAHYPMQTWLFREVHPLDGSAPRRATRAELLAESRVGGVRRAE